MTWEWVNYSCQSDQVIPILCCFCCGYAVPWRSTLYILQITTLPRGFRERGRDRERDRERQRLRERERDKESETEEDEEKERMMDEASEGEESDDTAYDRRHALPPCDLPWTGTDKALPHFHNTSSVFQHPPCWMKDFEYLRVLCVCSALRNLT